MAQVTSTKRGGCGKPENLTPIKPGQVLNPTGSNGATKRRAMLQAIGLGVMGERVKGRDADGKAVDLGPDGWTAVCRAMRNKAIKGDVGAATWLRDTIIGKPVDDVKGDLRLDFGAGLADAVLRRNGNLKAASD
jgi:hypothetical protein